MKILDKTNFLALPEGVFFAEGKRWDFGGLEVKGETIVISGRNCGYWSISLNWIDGNSDHETFDTLDRMQSQGSSHPMDTAYSKALPVDDDALFLVYENDDLDTLIELAQIAKAQAI